MTSQAVPTRAGRVGALVAALRPRQWLKNVLVLAAPLGAGSLFEPDVLVPTLWAVVAFCLASSGTYLVNDVADVEADRAHPVKRHRPVAAGLLPVGPAIGAAVLLLASAVLLGLAVRPALGATVAAYVTATLAYSLWLKHEPVLELALLALGFLLRAVAGGAATGIPLSQWFLIVAGFGSLFMAAGKRYSELASLAEGETAARRALDGYTTSYLRFVWGVAAGVTIMSYCLWAFEVAQVPSSLPWAVWSVLPFVLGVLRYAVDVDRGAAEAPEDAVLRDPVLLGLGLAWAVLFGLGALAV
ncbi:MAG: decaprenyl-phosphate phosphoribosyltransferase [Candidatus Nanopelagicales bacterium]